MLVAKAQYIVSMQWRRHHSQTARIVKRHSVSLVCCICLVIQKNKYQGVNNKNAASEGRKVAVMAEVGNRQMPDITIVIPLDGGCHKSQPKFI